MLPDAYTRFRDDFAGLLDERFYNIEWLDCQVANGAIRVLGNDKAVILFEFKRYPTGWLALEGMAAAGDLQEIRDVLIPQAENIARGMKCGSAHIVSREGWGKALKSQGYEPYQFGIVKYL